MRIVRHTLIIILASGLLPHLVAGQPLSSPENFFGFQMGADRNLVDWDQIVEYFTTLDEGSERVVVEELGKTTRGKPFLLATISSAENIRNLERYKTIQQQIANPYDLEEEQARALVEKGKAVVLVSMNIHSTEIGSSQESVELAYELITRTDPKAEKILDNVILLLIPSLNPDGLQMVVEWYRKWVGTPHEGCSMPWLYHHYAGHDDNRDWFMFNLQESQLTAQLLYYEWFPEIVFDQHQMGSSGPRLFLPPYADPINLNVHPTLMSEVNMLGKHVVSDMHAQGFKGIVTGMQFNAFFEGTMSKTPLWHNMVGILSEMASVRLATPIYLPRGSLGRYGLELPRYSTVTDFLDPWEGGWWRLRDIVEYEKAATFSILDLVATYKDMFLMNFYSMNRESIEKGKTEPPYAYIVPLDQHDPTSAGEMLKRLHMNGVRVFRSQVAFEYEGKSYPQGTYVIPLAQPCRPCIKDLMERQRYPDLRSYPGGPPQSPYDFTGWTLPLQMGAEVVEVTSPLAVELIASEETTFGPVGLINADGKTYLVERRYNNAFALLNKMLRSDRKVYWADESFRANCKEYPAGTIVIPDQPEVVSSLRSLSEELRVPIYGTDDPILARGSQVMLPRLGVYKGWLASIDEGWTRLVLDMYGFEYKSLANDDIKRGKLNEHYDVILLPSMSASAIVDGRDREDREPMIGTPETPKEYANGIGKEGVERLKEFVKAGGTLITIGSSCDFAIEKLRVPVVNTLSDVDSKEFYAPGALLQIELDTTEPLAYGMPKHPAIRFNRNPAFRLLPYNRESKAIGYYTDGNPLLSGWLIGPEKIAGKTALAEIPVEKGRVILFGFGVQTRAQTFGTFKLLFNAIYASRTDSVETLEVITK